MRSVKVRISPVTIILSLIPLIVFCVFYRLMDDAWDDIDISDGDRRAITRPQEDTSKGTRRRLPGAVIVGISKCGTRAVLSFLSVHPQVSCGTVEEPIPEINYFSHHYEQGPEWYRKQMPYSSPGQLTMEKSPRYFVIEGTEDRIKKFNRSMKIIVIACDPIYRYESQYMQNHQHAKSRKVQYPSIDERALYPNGDLRNSTELYYGCYFPFMVRWYRVFPSAQILVVDGDALRKEPYYEMLKVESFLGLKQFFTPSNFYFNATRGFHCPAKDGQVLCLSKDKGRQHMHMSPEIEQKMRDHYQQCNAPFFELTGRQFKWFSQR